MIRHRRAGSIILDRGRGDGQMPKIASIVTCAFASILAGSASAADLPLKAPPSAPPIFSWTGILRRLECRRRHRREFKHAERDVQLDSARRERSLDRQRQQSGTARMGSRRSDRFQLAGVALDCLGSRGRLAMDAPERQDQQQHTACRPCIFRCRGERLRLRSGDPAKAHPDRDSARTRRRPCPRHPVVRNRRSGMGRVPG